MSAADATSGKNLGGSGSATGSTVPSPSYGTTPATNPTPAPTAPVPPPGTAGPTAPGTAPDQAYPPEAPDGAAERGRRGIGYTTYAITIVVAVLALLLVLFVVQNDERVEIWLFGATPRMSVAGALSLSAAVGLVVGLLVGLIPQIKLRRELRQLRRASRR